ncbi:hypothetical protein [Sorangium sp. So ce124]|uniref:hypothetical protein n=1 Tax=Sorangium sp. So ce124 TaxID=3133280 RepID=UPI003F623389
MRVIMEIPEDAFRTPKTPEQVALEMRQAAAVFWVARGDIALEAVSKIFVPSALETEGTLYELLMQGPNGGDAVGGGAESVISAGSMQRENKNR